MKQTCTITNTKSLRYQFHPSGQWKHEPPVNVFLGGQFLRQFVRDGPRTVRIRITPAGGVVLFQVGLFECVEAPPSAPPPAPPKMRPWTLGTKPGRRHEPWGWGTRPWRRHHSRWGERPPRWGNETGWGHEVGGVIGRSKGRPWWRDNGDGGVARV